MSTIELNNKSRHYTQKKGIALKVAVIVPMYNEEENVKETISRISKILSQNYEHWELVVVDDGSTDKTLQIAKEQASQNPNIRVFSYYPNVGRGKALRTGFQKAKGDIIVSLDADLTSHESHIPKMVSALLEDDTLDIIIGSPFIEGGGLEGVSPYNYRELLSRMGNKFLELAFPGKLTYFTGVLRAYRRRILDLLELESDSKEIHLEILSKALAVGANVKEIPAISTGRKKGQSKTRVRATIISHLLFSFFEKPALLFLLSGLTLLIVGFGFGVYAIIIREQLNPTRPLMTLMVLLILVGIQTLFFGFIATQLVTLQREVYKVQKENLGFKKKL